MNRQVQFTIAAGAAALVAVCLASTRGEEVAQGAERLTGLEEIQSLLLAGDRAARDGKTEDAWKSFLQAREQFCRLAGQLSPAYVEIIVDRLTRQRQTGDVVRIGRWFLTRNKDNVNVTNRQRAKMQILIGDAYFADERFDTAREEYSCVVTTWPDTPERVEAEFRVARTHLFQKVFAKAEELLLKLTQSPQQEIAARAYAELGGVYHARGELKEALMAYQTAIEKGYRTTELLQRMEKIKEDAEKHRKVIERLNPR